MKIAKIVTKRVHEPQDVLRRSGRSHKVLQRRKRGRVLQDFSHQNLWKLRETIAQNVSVNPKMSSGDYVAEVTKFYNGENVAVYVLLAKPLEIT